MGYEFGLLSLKMPQPLHDLPPPALWVPCLFALDLVYVLRIVTQSACATEVLELIKVKILWSGCTGPILIAPLGRSVAESPNAYDHGNLGDF